MTAAAFKAGPLALGCPILSQLVYAPLVWRHATEHARRSHLHGPEHWERVAEHGVRIGTAMDADLHVVLAFAIVHDAFRLDDEDDPGHGSRASAFAAEYGNLLVHDDDRVEHLMYALLLHADGHTSDDPTVGTCWDADRLDLPRVGVEPDPDLLSTTYAKLAL